ncbi:MAG: TonB-dependent receptor [Steroidobacteraceae bacterium]|nr:TonB-dependent receptor [Steroidobacteraceae bacterium]
MSKSLNLLGLMIAASLGATAHAQEAQDPAPPPEGEEIADVVVTGSRIARTGYDTPTPVTVIDMGAIQASGRANLADFVNELPSVAGSDRPSTANRSLSSGAAGLNTINLRSLGNQRTLVLLDGRRSVGSVSQGTVDVNTFPQGLVKSIEIVTGGASAAYGSDAVSGVVNFVLDKDFTGLKVNLEAGATTYGDDDNRTATVTAGSGFAGGRGHVLFNAEAARREGVYGVPRDWLDAGWHMVNNPAYTPTNGAPEYFVAPNSGQSVMTPGGIITNTALRGTYFGINGVVNQFAYGATRDPWTIGGDWRLGLSNDRTSLEPESNRDGLFGRVSWDFADNLTAYAEASWNQNEALQWGGEQSDKGTIIIRADNAFIPASVRTRAQQLGIAQFNLGSSNADIPTRESDNERKVTRYVFGLDGSFTALGTGWKWDAYWQRGVTKTNESLYTANTARLALAQDAVLNPATGQVVCRSTLANPTNGCVPFNRMGVGVNSQAAVDYIMGRPERDQRFQQDVAAINFSTNFDNPWLQPIGFAIGAEWRKEQISGFVESQFQNGWIVGNFLPTFGDYTVKEAYVETLVPLPARLEFNGAVRATDYSESGQVTTYKVGLTWGATQDLRLRATVSRDIRAPNLDELFLAGRRRTNFVTDPFNNNVSQRFVETVTGNLALTPEKADQFGIGLVYQPSFAEGLGFSADYYSIDIEDAISQVTAQDIVNRCFDGNQTFCSAFRRDPASQTGQELIINNSPFNFVSEKARGLDLEASYRTPLNALFGAGEGNITLRALATRYLEMSENNGVDPPTDRAGQNTGDGPPKWLYRLTAGWSSERASFQLTGRGISAGTYFNSYVECTSGCPRSTALNRTINTNRIAGAFYLDAFASYSLDVAGAESQVFFKVLNVADRDPVVVGLGPGDSSNVEPGINRALYDYLGRTFKIGFRMQWGRGT